MGTFIKALLISASIAGLANMAAMAAGAVTTGQQDEVPCQGVEDAVHKQVAADPILAAPDAGKSASAAKGGSPTVEKISTSKE